MSEWCCVMAATNEELLEQAHATLAEAEAGQKRERHKLDTLAEQYRELERENGLLKQALGTANDTADYYAWDPTAKNDLDTLCENVQVRISSTWLKELIAAGRADAEAALREAVALIREIEWEEVETTGGDYAFSKYFCLVCGNEQGQGHEEDCKLGQALQSPATKAAGERWRAMDRVVEAAKELNEVAELRGDNQLPHPADDPKTWTARMQDAWNDLADALNAYEEAKGE